MKICTVCKNKKIEFFLNVKGLDYWQCSHCKATMLDPIQFVSSNKEKKHYLKHNNEINDARYRTFLSNLLLNHLKIKFLFMILVWIMDVVTLQH